MKLYFSRGACSLSPHIVLRETGAKFELEEVTLSTHKTKAGEDFFSINPKGYVPALVLDDGQILTEGPAIVQYLADQNPQSKVAPPAGTFERYRLQEMLNYISTEIHKAFSPLFNPKLADDVKQAAKDKLRVRLELLEKGLGTKPFLLGDTFTAADAYLYTVLRWAGHTQVDLSKFSNLTALVKRVGERPAVRAALEAEGLK